MNHSSPFTYMWRCVGLWYVEKKNRHSFAIATKPSVTFSILKTKRNGTTWRALVMMAFYDFCCIQYTPPLSLSFSFPFGRIYYYITLHQTTIKSHAHAHTYSSCTTFYQNILISLFHLSHIIIIVFFSFQWLHFETFSDENMNNWLLFCSSLWMNASNYILASRFHFILIYFCCCFSSRCIAIEGYFAGNLISTVRHWNIFVMVYWNFIFADILNEKYRWKTKSNKKTNKKQKIEFGTN